MDYLVEQLRYQLREDPASRAFFKLGEHLRREGERDEAIAVLRAGLGHHPRYVAAWVSLGRALLEAGANAEAAAALERALALDPENAVAARFAGEAAIAGRDWLAAIKTLKRARALAGPDELLDARILYVEGRLADLGQLEVPPPRPLRPAPEEPPAPPEDGGEPAVFPVAAAPAAPAADGDVFVPPPAAEQPPAADETPPPQAPAAADDGVPRATVAIRLSELGIPPMPAPAPASDAAPVSTPPSASAPEPAEEDLFDPFPEALPPVPASATVPAADAGAPFDPFTTAGPLPAAAPVSLPLPAPASELEPEAEEPAEPDFRADELPLPTMTLARLALEQGDLELAEKTLRGVLVRDPDHGEAAALLANLVGAAPPADPAGRAAARTAALRRWLDAVRLAAERLQA